MHESGQVRVISSKKSFYTDWSTNEMFKMWMV